MQALVPKNRKPKFDLTLRIIDLNNIPLVCGTCSVKWHLPSSISAEHRGKTEKAVVREHRATFDYVKEIPVRLTIDKVQKLQECDVHFEILQEYHEGAKGRVLLGNVTLNLAEYVNPAELDDRDVDANTEPDEDGDVRGGITRRYLMKESKINSTLKIGIEMKQTEGDTDFTSPPLKSATVFGGIAGVVSTEPTADGDEVPTMSSKTRELGELQDVYRRNLAATWACMAGELPPDKLVEDLFAGGDGGRMDPPQTATNRHQPAKQEPRDDSAGSSTSDSESRRTVTPHHLSPNPSHHTSNRDEQQTNQRRMGSRSQDVPGSGGLGSGSPTSSNSIGGSGSFNNRPSGVSGRSSIDQQIRHSSSRSNHGGDSGRQRGNYREVTEYDIREDLRNWQIKAR